MLDICEAIKCLNEQSASLAERIKIHDNFLNCGVPQHAQSAVNNFALLETDSKQAVIVRIVLMEEFARLKGNLMTVSTEDIQNLANALSRSLVAGQEAHKVILAHEEREKPRRETKNAFSKKLDELRERGLLGPKRP